MFISSVAKADEQGRIKNEVLFEDEVRAHHHLTTVALFSLCRHYLV
jgi:hypothetical protein